MRLLFISYWGFQEGLTSATVTPHLRILSEIESIEKIIFCSIERKDNDVRQGSILHPKILHIPLKSQSKGNVFLTKANDFILFPKQLVQICSEYKIDKIVCRSSMAGALGYLVSRKNRIPFVVESFEPHAESMIESGVWTKLDPRYWIELFFEKQQIKKAVKLFPVSHHYRRRLINEGVSEKKIVVMPCCVNVEDFKFDDHKRFAVREQLGIRNEHIVGIYVGKYGGIYYDEEAFDLYFYAFEYFGSQFHLVVLTEQDHAEVLKKCSLRGIDTSRVSIHRVGHDQVSAYLSAADFAFSTIKPVPSRLYCSPIKDGEYWANGLPILLEPNIGDDSDIIALEGGGVILKKGDERNAFDKLFIEIKNGRMTNASKIEQIARKHRSMEHVRNIYRQEFDHLSN